MEKDWSAREFQDELARLPQLEGLQQLVRAITEKLLASRRRDVAAVAAPFLKSVTINRLDNQTSLGDPLAALERGPQNRREQILLGAILARSIAASPPVGVEAEDRTAGELLWFAAHAGFDVFPSLDAAFDGKVTGIWGALCDLLRRVDRGREPSLDRADALVGALALQDASQEDIRTMSRKLADEIQDPTLAGLLRGGAAKDPSSQGKIETRLVGELQPSPRPAWLIALTAITGWMLLESGVRLLSRTALQRRSPAELEFSGDGLRVRARTEMLGKVLREVEHVVPLDGLAIASREVRFPRLALYMGLLALMLGSYFGASLFGDGIKAASPSLLGQGALLLALGIALELGATLLFPGVRGRCRVILVPKKGRALCIGEVNTEEARRTLASIPHQV